MWYIYLLLFTIYVYTYIIYRLQDWNLTQLTSFQYLMPARCWVNRAEPWGLWLTKFQPPVRNQQSIVYDCPYTYI